MSETLIDEGPALQTVVKRTKETPEQRAKRRELESRYRAYSCNECGEIHSYESDAAGCCPPMEVYVCPTCSKVHTDAIDAQSCERAHVGEVGNLEDACPVCGEIAGEPLQALNCCLWRTLSFAQRLELHDHYRFRRFDLAAAMLPH